MPRIKKRRLLQTCAFGSAASNGCNVWQDPDSHLQQLLTYLQHVSKTGLTDIYRAVDVKVPTATLTLTIQRHGLALHI